MYLIPALTLIPFIGAILIYFDTNHKRRGYVIYGIVALMMLCCFLLVGQWILQGAKPWHLYSQTGFIDLLMQVIEVFLMIFIVYKSFQHKKRWISLLAIGQTVLTLWVEHSIPLVESTHTTVDSLALLMCILCSVVGGLIGVYSVGYMKSYHENHRGIIDRSNTFLALLFVFMAAMFGLVLSSNLIWMYFFWEVTSVISFLLIGYTQTDEAIDNSFKALWMNLLGGIGFAVAIWLCAMQNHSVQMQDIVSGGNTMIIGMLCLAGLAKSAQLPFSTWLFGAMVAPTPSSALLHSATMVKAGVYLLIRLAPALYGNLCGMVVAFIGGFTFITTSMMAIAQNDAKKVLAFSTISNLGLIVACAGIGVEQTVWAAIFLMIFHSVSKSMLFESVGATENSIGSRDIEHMHGLILRLPKLAYIMGIGIAGMYLAPFGMLISKWVALKAFVDSGNVLLVIFIAFGSASTMFYWTKWLGKLIAMHKPNTPDHDATRKDEYFSMGVLGVIMILLCLLFPLLAGFVVNPIVLSLFGATQDVLSMSELTTMVIMVCSVLLVPSMMFLITRMAPRDYVPTYMNGVNVGDNSHFIDSMGESKKLYLSNWYLRFEFGRRRLLRPSQIVAASVLIVTFAILLGGAIG
ncbi:NADH-quinone oxidoreductase subunit L [Faecalicoccus pleomorphus]|uniref:NADH-quinone oxidoreductase subunit 5 family protein n=1 Tax=Faecalicoccus pleomorphus TaxID=1323 RepID=UPI00195F9FC3|nr:proton-conducting transporter membrane subunit [Faecalicoccus pleomorphus]MBM6678118.1 NADH-quinone oxidoreductase subunit L [Faecalicoccus pleomorphus]